MFGVSSSWRNPTVTLLQQIQNLELKTGKEGSDEGYRYVKTYTVDVKEGNPLAIVPSTEEPVQRETTVRLLEGEEVQVYWEGTEETNESFFKLNKELSTFVDCADGGLQLNCLASSGDAKIAVILRQKTIIITDATKRQEMNTVHTLLFIHTEKDDYSQFIDDYEKEERLYYALSSDDGIVGHKLFLHAGAPVAEALSFTIDATGLQTSGNKIVLQTVKVTRMVGLLFLAAFPSDSLYNDFTEIWNNLEYGLGSIFKYRAETSTAAGGEINFRPDFPLFLARFVALNTASNIYDTCIVTGYKPNTENPAQGGTFTLGGF